MADQPMTPAEDAVYVAIIHGKQEPDPVARQAGRNAHAEGVLFGDGPRPIQSVKALSWRIGWNERALEER